MDECWYCGEELAPHYNYCGACAVPVGEYPPENPGSALNHISIKYVKAIIDEKIEFPDDPDLPDELQKSMKTQLLKDIQSWYTGIAIVHHVDEGLLFAAVKEDLERMLSDDISDDDWFDSLTREGRGFTDLILALGGTFPPAMFRSIYEAMNPDYEVDSDTGYTGDRQAEMTRPQKTPASRIVQRPDGTCICPKCGFETDGMHEWTDHVSDEHDPFAEFIRRWTSFTGEPAKDG